MRVGKRPYDFAGWVTKNDILCADGATIKHDAFRDNHGQQVPLVWNHNYDTPNNVLGHIILENRDKGVYGYGYFNDTTEAENAKRQVKHGDISNMSIGARKIKRKGSDVVSGSIYEVSLVMASANPGATIESIMTHSESGEEEGIIYTGNLIHSADDIVDRKEDEELNNVNEEDKNENGKTIEEVIDTMNDEQKQAVYALIGAIEQEEEERKKEQKTDGELEDEDLEDEEVLKQNDEQTKKDDEDDEPMKHNVFNKDTATNQEETLKHGINEVLRQAAQTKANSFRDLLNDSDVIKHGINDIEMLFPEAYNTTNGATPMLFRDSNTAYEQILSKVHKSPFSRIKTVVADLTEDEARAKGYIKGDMKKEEFFSLIKRKTEPTTVYKKQKIDRDDVIDITDFDVVAFMQVEMQFMLKEEIARAILVGDGRDFSDADKIDEQHIRPIVTDNEFFTIHKSFVDATVFIEAVIKAMAEYRGSGKPDMYIEPTLLADVKLLKGTDGRYLFGDIPSNEAIAARLGLGSIIDTSFMQDKGALIVNLRDYSLGATKGGEVTNFNDFDIDFNQYKYLAETRLSGALTVPKSAIHLVKGATPTVGADDTAGGVQYGKRQPVTP